MSKTTQELQEAVIRFAGDSGDGMQLVGTRFTDTSALFGNDLATLPAFPAEIRAPQGTVAGVSSFQVQIADFDILTPGDAPDVLVAMNPAALKAHLQDLTPNGMLILNEDAFDEKNIKKDEAESLVHDVLNVFMCTGFTHDTHQYFMKASPVRPGDFLEFFAEVDLLGVLSACPGGDCSAEHSSDTAKCFPLQVSVYKSNSQALDDWTSPSFSKYNQLHGL